MELSIETVTRWATTNELDDAFEEIREDDPEYFEHEVLRGCDERALLAFAMDRNSTKRQFFAYSLVERLVRCLYSPDRLPYHFSRFEGMLSYDEYKAQELSRIEVRYGMCCIVETMRISSQEEIQNLANMILDYRHDQLLPDANTSKLLRLLHHQIEVSLRLGVTSYSYRLCKTCNDGFKSWRIPNEETDTDRCPFCILRIAYPQKNRP